MFRKVLVANRGEIACRVMRTLDRLGIASVAVASPADRASRHVDDADEVVVIEGDSPLDAYLDADRIVAAALEVGAEAVHPGYGFLSERAEFAEACAAAGLVFVGPTPAQLRAFGTKHGARALAERHGVPLLPGTDVLPDLDAAREAAAAIGYPVMLKSTAGGGGIGMRRCDDAGELAEAFAVVARLGASHFGDGGVLLERFVARARHLEVQIFGDGRDVVALGERDCSLQRRNQKVVEETPAPGISDAERQQLADAAVRLGCAVGYRSAGTVEFVHDCDREEFAFLEVNARLQVEHGVTEAVSGIDLVEWMLLEAAGELDLGREVAAARPLAGGHAIEARLYAEDPANDFRPSTGELTDVRFPPGVRCDTWVARGTPVTPHFDPLLAKLVVHGADRADAVRLLRAALDATRLAGLETNLGYLRAVTGDPEFARGGCTTTHLAAFPYEPATVEVLDGGTQTSVQEHPGRLGYWAVGVPPSGPMDDLAFRLANRLVGNAPGTAALELTFTGPTLRFRAPAVVALTGAEMDAELDGRPVPWWAAVPVGAGAVLRVGGVRDTGARAYLAIGHGFDVPEYLGSRATFVLGGFGGHAGRALRVGDVLHLREAPAGPPGVARPAVATRALAAASTPAFTHDWEIGVLVGPHSAPDFFTERDVETFFSTAWEVHHHSDRTGVRLIGPKPEWARPDGGEAGLHPSNIHDNEYAIGTVDFTGDMPIVLGPDGPSLGGFVCPATVAGCELWKVGQLRPGDRVRFRPMSHGEARRVAAEQEQWIGTLERPGGDRSRRLTEARSAHAVLHRVEAAPQREAVTFRRAGDRYVLIEFGDNVLDLGLRFRAHALMGRLAEEPIPGVLELAPGIRSLQVRYDPAVIGLDNLVGALAAAEQALGPVDDMEVPSRVVHLPLSWDDPAARLAVERYARAVRADAPWCPSNLEFIRRINGLADVDEVREIVFGASYLVLGLGDVYLGAPVATPLDPRHRLVTTKYNPARTWTPENAVGIGGAYLCVYGMEGPGGYQLVGRTVQMWNRFRVTPGFRPGRPWLLDFFDRLRFHPVSERELARLRDDLPFGRARLEIEEATLRLADHRRFLTEHAAEIAAFTARRERAFAEERARWADRGVELVADRPDTPPPAPAELAIPPGGWAVSTPIQGNVCRLAVGVGDVVAAGDVLVVLEAMKTETAIRASAAGTVVELRCGEGVVVSAGQPLVVFAAA
ncbi:MAG TPA: urea carboxylase [Acidimicrobiia bacterium]|nr:urea carboxylase [Acidimicrobiia bacterium]